MAVVGIRPAGSRSDRGGALAGPLEWLLRCVVAQLLVGGAGYVACGLAFRLLPGASPALRWTAVGIAGLWLASVGGQLLLALGAFSPLPALALVGSAALIVYLDGRRRGGVLGSSGEERAALPAGAGTGRALGAIGLAVSIVVSVRALVLPIVAWDSLTYHAVKAGLWVQGGAYETLAAPGGWSIYRTYVGGGELLLAWAMLPFRSDLLAGVVDVGVWLFLGLGLVALGEALGLPRGARWAGAAYVLALPAVARAVGSLYVDNAFALALIGALVLLLASVEQDRPPATLLALMALGVALGIKVFAAPVVLLLVPVLPLVHGRRFWQPRWLGWTAAGTVAAGLAAAPWWLRNIRLTGYPLSPLPITIGGLPLGRANEALAWYLTRPRWVDAGWGDELMALGRMFGFPGLTPLAEPTLGALTVVPVVLGAAALLWMARTQWRRALLVTASAAPLWIAFYGEGLRVTRLQWASVSGRYLLAAVAVGVVASLTWWTGSGWARRAYHGLLLLGAAALVALSDVRGWQGFEVLPGLGCVGLAALGAVVGRRVRAWSLRSQGRWAAGVLAVLLALGALQAYRDATRETALRTSVALHPSPRYWVTAALAVDTPRTARRIAVTAGAAQDADNWMLYPFLGSRLQNELLYVPVTEDGTLVEPAPGNDPAGAASFSAWLQRLADLEVTEIISFRPASLELAWMELRPDRFERIAGDRRSWGLYRRVEPAVDP